MNEELDPALVSEIEGIGADLVKHANRHYVIQHSLSGAEALDWMDSYRAAAAGDRKAGQEMVEFLYEYALRLQEMLEVGDSDEEIANFNAHNSPPEGDEDGQIP